MYECIMTGQSITPAGYQDAHTGLNINVAAGRFDWQVFFFFTLRSCGNQSIHSSNKLGNSGIHSAPLSWMNQAGGGLLWLEEKTPDCVSRVGRWTGGGGRESLNLRVQSGIEPIMNSPATSWLPCFGCWKSKIASSKKYCG